MNGIELKKVYEELKKFSKMDMTLPIVDYTKRIKPSIGPGESDLFINMPLEIRFTPVPNEISGPIILKVVKQRKQGDKIVINNEQQTIFAKFCSEE